MKVLSLTNKGAESILSDCVSPSIASLWHLHGKLLKTTPSRVDKNRRGVQEKTDDMEKETQINEEELSKSIREYVKAVEKDSNPEELELYKKLIKKNVPFLRRGYFAAYLLREMSKSPARKERKEFQKRDRKDFKEQRKDFEGKPQQQQQRDRGERLERRDNAPKERKETPFQQPKREVPADAKTLYINLGKMGRIYAKNLVELLTKDSGLTRDDIYSVRVHDKYSFVQMSEENCQKAIDALLGKDVNGRTVQINISNREARRRDDVKAPESKPAAEEPVNASPAEKPEIPTAPESVENEAQENS